MPQGSRLRTVALGTALVLGAGLLTLPTSTSAAVAAARPAASPPPSSSVSWTPCTGQLAGQGLECGSLLVPRDHARPAAGTVRIALSRRPHTSPERDYRGVIVVNPGGPGQPGRALAAIGGYVPEGVGETYDWVGFDPRGVGASTPSLHCSRSHFGVDRPPYVPRRAGVAAYWLRKAQAYAAACADSPGEAALLPHLSTADSVADLELLRAALGVETISYYGFSYGSYLGQVYATRHPTRVGRFVLDGVVDPTRVWYAANLDQSRAFDANLDAFWRYVASHPRSYRLGTRWRQVRRGYHRLLSQLDRRPAAEGRLGPAELTDALLEAGYYAYDWPQLAAEYSRLKRLGRGGDLFARYRDGNLGDDNAYAVYNATQCTDAAWPGWSRQAADARALHRRAPFLTWANTWYNAPCLFWRAPAKARPAVHGTRVTAPVLLVSETRDAATPYSGAVRVRSLFPTARLVAGMGGTTHSSSLSGVACVDLTIAAYLRSGALPARAAGAGPDRRCPAVPPGGVGAAGARTTGGDPLPPALRRLLQGAQTAGR